MASHRTAETLTRDEAIAIARAAAVTPREGYVPAGEDFLPPEWVIDAVQEAYAAGHSAGAWWQSDRDHWGDLWH